MLFLFKDQALYFRVLTAQGAINWQYTTCYLLHIKDFPQFISTLLPHAHDHKCNHVHIHLFYDTFK